MQDQKQVWNSIAPEWYEYKNNSDPKVLEFVEKAKGKLLDLGCGAGRNFAKTNAEIYALDFSEEMIKYAKIKAEKMLGKKIANNIIKTDNKKSLIINNQLNSNQNNKGNFIFIQHDLDKKLPFEANTFNNVICIATLHCIKGKENRIKILKEVYRVLKPKGKLLIKVWNRNNIRFGGKRERMIKWTDKGERYYYFYTADELEKEVLSVGLKIKKLEHKNKRTGFESQEITILAET